MTKATAAIGIGLVLGLGLVTVLEGDGVWARRQGKVAAELIRQRKGRKGVTPFTLPELPPATIVRGHTL